MSESQQKAWQAVLAALTARIQQNPRGELSAFANEIGVTRGTVSRWLSGNLKGSRIPYAKMSRILYALNLNPADYYTHPANYTAQTSSSTQQAGYAPPTQQHAGPAAFITQSTAFSDAQPEYYQVPWLEAQGSMGGGSLEVSKEVKSYLSFRRDWLLSKGQPANMVVVSAMGDSMSPTIPDGSVVLINESGNAYPVNNRIYLVCYREELFLKRLRVVNNKVTTLISDYDGSETPVLPGEYFNIIGRAIWYGKDL